MTNTNRQRVALVTGGAVRLGRAIALGLADAGYDLVIGYRSSDAAALDVKAEVTRMGGVCEIVRGDLTEPDAPARLIDAARQAFGRLDVLINSAASFRAVPLLDVDAEEWDAVMALNTRAPHLTTRAAADLLRASRGAVINIVDVGAFEAWTEHPHHAVSKAALAHLTRIQARVLAPEVRVNAIAPGAVLLPDDWDDERSEALAAQAALRRLGSPDDIVEAVLYLLEAEFITGQILRVDGGRLS